MSRDEIIQLAAYQLVIEYGHLAIYKQTNILTSCVPAYLQQDPDIELDIIVAYDTVIRMPRDDAQLLYVNMVKNHDFFGSHTFKLLVFIHFFPEVFAC